jgi:anti-sigma B factor antagonist
VTLELSPSAGDPEGPCNLTPVLVTDTEMQMGAPQGFAVEVEIEGDTATAHVRGELDLSNATALAEALVTSGKSAASVVADLQGVGFIDSSAIGALVSAGRALSESGSRLQIGARSRAVAQILAITGLADGAEAFDVLPDPSAEQGP